MSRTFSRRFQKTNSKKIEAHKKFKQTFRKRNNNRHQTSTMSSVQSEDYEEVIRESSEEEDEMDSQPFLVVKTLVRRRIKMMTWMI